MASPVDTSVKFYREDFPGAPVLNGVAGAVIGLLDACLVTGFGLRTATSVVVAGGVATVTLPSDAKNPNLLYSVVLVDGVTGSMAALNGEQRVTAATATTLQFATAVANGTATGTITVKTAPAGWQKLYTGTNKAAFKRLAVESLGMLLRVDDSGASSCTVRGYEAMSDVDTGTGPFPTVAQSATGVHWAKSTAANSTANQWDLISDARAFYFCPLAAVGANATGVGQGAYYFGDIIPAKSGDAFACAVSGSATAPGSAANNGSVWEYATAGNRYVSRSVSGAGSASALFGFPESGGAVYAPGNDAHLGVFPPPDGGLRLARILANEGAQTGTSATPRGVYPGVFHIPQSNVHLSFQRSDVLAPVAGLGGRRLAFLNALPSFASPISSPGRMPIDITGPWR